MTDDEKVMEEIRKANEPDWREIVDGDDPRRYREFEGFCRNVKQYMHTRDHKRVLDQANGKELISEDGVVTPY